LKDVSDIKIPQNTSSSSGAAVFHEDEQVLYVHAGLVPENTFETDEEVLVWTRDLDFSKDTPANFVSLAISHGLSSPRGAAWAGAFTFTTVAWNRYQREREPAVVHSSRNFHSLPVLPFRNHRS
jgi:hypothetical protein